MTFPQQSRQELTEARAAAVGGEGGTMRTTVIRQ